MKKTILDTDICKIENTGNELNVFIHMKEGGWLEHVPFPNDLRGLVSALDLAINCISGKFYPRREKLDNFAKSLVKNIEFKEH